MGTQQLIYIFNKETLFFEYEYKAQKDPFKVGYYLYPPNSTIIKPPIFNIIQIPKWNKLENKWDILPDFSNIKVWNKTTGLLEKVEIGYPLSNNQTLNYQEVEENIKKIPIINKLKESIIHFSNQKLEDGIIFKDHIIRCKKEDINDIFIIYNYYNHNIYSNSNNIDIDDKDNNNIQWRTKNNNWLLLSVNELKDLYCKMYKFWQDNYIKSRKLIDNLINLSYDKLINYDINNYYSYY